MGETRQIEVHNNRHSTKRDEMINESRLWLLNSQLHAFYIHIVYNIFAHKNAKLRELKPTDRTHLLSWDLTSLTNKKAFTNALFSNARTTLLSCTEHVHT